MRPSYHEIDKISNQAPSERHRFRTEPTTLGRNRSSKITDNEPLPSIHKKHPKIDRSPQTIDKSSHTRLLSQ